MTNNRWRGLSLQLFILVVLPLTVLLLIIAFGSLFLHQRAMRSLVGERDQRAARAAATAIGEQLNHRAAAVRGLAAHAADVSDPAETLDDNSFLLPDFDGGLAIFDPDGTLLAASSESALWALPQVRQALTADRSLGFSRDDTPFSSAFVHPLTGEWMMLAVASEEGLTAAGAFSPATLARRALADVFGAGEAAAAFVVNEEGDVLFQTGKASLPSARLITQPGVADALRGDSGTTYVDVQGTELVIAYSPVPDVNWALVIEEPWQAVADPMLHTTEIAPLILAPALVIALVALWFGVRQIVQPLHALQQKATELAWGNFEAIEEPVGGIAEIGRLQTELVRMADKVQAAQRALRSYLGAVTAGQEEERRRLARELHDDTLQSLIALNQRVQLVQLSLDGHPAVERLAEVQGMTKQLMADLRRLTHALRPTYLEDLGLVPALEMLARDTGATLGIPVIFRASGPGFRLSPEVELALYRIVQEALSNMARHSKATRTTVELEFGNDDVELTISDNGRGFVIPESPADLAPAGHFGLLGLHERAELIGARLTIASAPDEGTQVTIICPTRPSN